MPRIKSLSFALAFICLALALTARAQTPRVSTVNVTADEGRVRVSTEGDVSEVRLDVADDSGDIVFQSGAVSGQALDWDMTNSRGERVRPGTYLVTVTYRTQAGKLKKRVEQVLVEQAVTTTSAQSPVGPSPQATVSTAVPVKAAGSVTVGRIPKFTALTSTQATVADSVITQTSAGNIGVGITAPAVKLHLYGPNSRLRLQSTTASQWTVTEYRTDNRMWHTGVGGSTVSNDLKGKYYIYDGTANANRLVIDTDGNVGIGTTSPQYRLDVSGGAFTSIHGKNTSGEGVRGESDTSTGVVGTSNGGSGVFGGSGRSTLNDFDAGVYGRNISGGYAGYFDGPVKVAASSAARALEVRGRARVSSIPPEASVAAVCFNSAGDLLQCGASSLRLKSNVRPFLGGLEVVSRLRPISFDWKDGSGHDVGLAAEEVADVAPQLTFTGRDGKVAGVKYDRIPVLLINAVKEQQQLIERQSSQIAALTRKVEEQQAQLNHVRRSVRHWRAAKR